MSARTFVTVFAAGALALSGAVFAQQSPPEQEGEGAENSEVSAYLEALPDRFPESTWTLDQVPDGTWSDRQLQALADQGITTVGDFIRADTQVVGRIMGLEPEEVQQLQGGMLSRLDTQQPGVPP